jgi:hypothetical protein
MRARLIVKWFLAAAGTWLVACNPHRDVTQNPVRWSRLDRDYVLTEPVFLVRWIESGEYSLEIPGKSGVVPCSIEEYYAYPTTWMYKEPFLRGERGIGYTPVVAVIPAGASLHLSRITEMKSPYGSLVLSIWGRICDSPYSQLEVDTSSLMDGCVDLDPRPVPKPEYLLAPDYRAQVPRCPPELGTAMLPSPKGG